MDESVRHSILLVDDEPEILYSLKSLLRREFDLHTAECGEDALQIFAQQSIDIVMTDQRMPGMTGTELMEKVRLTYPDSIRIIFTGYADSKAVVDSVNRAEVYRYITKPWDPDELLEVLHVAGKRHDATTERRQIHLEMKRHLCRSQALTERIRAGEPMSQGLSADLDQCLGEATQLAERLERVIDHENAAVGVDPSRTNE